MEHPSKRQKLSGGGHSSSGSSQGSKGSSTSQGGNDDEEDHGLQIDTSIVQVSEDSVQLALEPFSHHDHSEIHDRGAAGRHHGHFHRRQAVADDASDDAYGGASASTSSDTTPTPADNTPTSTDSSDAAASETPGVVPDSTPGVVSGFIPGVVADFVPGIGTVSTIPEPTGESSTVEPTPTTESGSMGSSSQIVLASPPSTPVLSESSMAFPLASAGAPATQTTIPLTGSNGATATASSTPEQTSGSISGGSVIPAGSAVATNSLNSTSSLVSTSSSLGSSSILSSSGSSLIFGPLSESTSFSFSISSFSTSTTSGFESSFTTSSGSQSSSSSLSSSGSSTISSSSFRSSSATSTVSNTAGAGAVGASPTITNEPSSSTTAAGAIGNNTNTVTTGEVVGSVVGGLAGLALIFAVLLLILRRMRQKRRAMQPLPGEPETLPAAGGGTDGPRDPQMTYRSNLTPMATAAAWFGSGRRSRPASEQTAKTSGTGGTSERGFQKISGYKMPSAFSPGRGDGYGTLGEHAREGTLSGQSFYRDSGGFYGGSGVGVNSPPPSSFTGPSSPGQTDRPISDDSVGQVVAGYAGRNDDVAVLRPSPARTPVTNQGPWEPTTTNTPPVRPRLDGIGRSHPSYDGSRGSRFTEDVV